MGGQCEVDNITYAMFLSERVRSRVEDAGRVVLTDTEAVALVRTKEMHLVLLVIAVIASVASAPHAGNQGTKVAGFPIFAFLVANVAQGIKPGVTATEFGHHVARSIGGFFLSLFGMMLCMLVTFF